MKYQRLKNLVVLVTAAAYFAATFLGQKMKLRILCEKLLIISQRFFGIPPFRFYALADGIKNILSQTPTHPQSSPRVYSWNCCLVGRAQKSEETPVNPLMMYSRRPLGSPDPELGAPMRSHPVSHGDDHIQVVELREVALAVGRSSQVFLDNWILPQLALIKDVLDVQADVLLDRLKELGHLSLRQPDGLFL
jgi:hypothetical protein